MISRKVLKILVSVGVLAPIPLVIVAGAGRLLAALGDDAGAKGLERVVLGGAIVWAVTLTLLVAALGILALEQTDDRRAAGEKDQVEDDEIEESETERPKR